MRNSVSQPALHPRSVLATTYGSIDVFDWVDGIRGLLPHIGLPRVPVGAPLVVSGWAVDPSSDVPPAAVTVVLDSATFHNAEIDLDRTDVQALLGPATPADIGFRTIIPTDNLQPGSHELRVYALGSDGAWYEAAYIPFGIYASMQPALGTGTGFTRITLDIANAIAPLGDFAIVSGWAVDLDRHNAAYGVCATDDRGGRWNSLFDVPRPDVRASIGANSDLLGFEIAVPTGALGRGQHRLSVQAFDAAGRRVGRALEFELEVACEMRLFPGFAQLTADTVHAAMLVKEHESATVLGVSRVITCEQGDILPIEGWAFATDESAPQETAQIFLELKASGVEIPPIRYQPIAGFTRKKTPPELPEPPCDDAWFSYKLDTTNLAPRTYTLRVAVVRAGRCFYARGDFGRLCVLEAVSLPKTARRL